MITKKELKRDDKYLVAKYEDGTYLFLEETANTTSPCRVKNPFDATKKRPYDLEIQPDYFVDIKEPAFYFENSSRMWHWLQGSKMVVVEENLIVTTIEKD